MSLAWATDLVVVYLTAMEVRDLEAAQKFVAPGDVELVFPGGRRFTRIEQIVANSGGRYRFVKKRVTRREAWQAEGKTCAMISGTLYGEWPDGTPFEDIRFVDRFELIEGLIVRQEVWNDAGERLLSLQSEGNK